MSRIYYVSAPDFGKHLVRANTPHQAIALVAKEMLQIKDYYYKKKYLDRILSGLQ